MSKTFAAWMNEGKYLPSFMRDFHDQKELFKTIDDAMIKRPEDMVKRPDWVSAHCYVIDVFLWFMAMRGYTLQRSRKQAEFRDIEADLKEWREWRLQQARLVNTVRAAAETSRESGNNSNRARDVAPKEA